MALKFSYKTDENGVPQLIPMGKVKKLAYTLTKESKKEDNQIHIILKELENLVGLYNVKKLIYEIQAFIKIQTKRKEENLNSAPLVLHMIFMGNPGTGKTTVARNIGSLFKELKVLKKGHIVEVERADLVGEYIGHTAIKTREQIKKALGGILFIDEAYSLARGGEKDFGKEAIDCLTKALEDYKDDLVVILAGYKKEMNWFLKTNPGLRSRFPIHIEFYDYSLNELIQIAELMLDERQYTLTPDAKNLLHTTLQKHIIQHQPYSGNARMVRNIIEKAIRCQAVRLIEKKDLSRNDLIYITCNDIKESIFS